MGLQYLTRFKPGSIPSPYPTPSLQRGQPNSGRNHAGFLEVADSDHPAPSPPHQFDSRAQESFHLVVNLYVLDYTLQVQINSMYYPILFDLVNNEQVYFKAICTARNKNYEQVCGFPFSPSFFPFLTCYRPSRHHYLLINIPPDTAIM